MRTPLEYIITGNKFYGVEVTSIVDDSMLFKIAVLKKQKDELNLSDTVEGEDFKSSSAKKHSACVVLNTDKVLTKCFHAQAIQQNHLIEHAFPNLDRTQFYVQTYTVDDFQSVSIVRKQHADTCIESLRTTGIYATSIVLGNTLVFGLKQLSDAEEVYTSNAKVNLGEIPNIQKAKDIDIESYDIQGQHINSEYLLAFLAGVQQCISIIHTEHNFQIILQTSKSEYNQMLFFYYGLRSAVAVLLVGLMINFFYFNSYYSFVQQHQNLDNSKLQSVLTPLKTQVDRLDKLTIQILENKGSSTSFVLNSIVEVLPKSIQLEELSFQPLAKRIRQNRPVELAENTIRITGRSFSKEDFAHWNTQLEREEWVNEIVIKRFDALSVDSHAFEILIHFEL